MNQKQTAAASPKQDQAPQTPPVAPQPPSQPTGAPPIQKKSHKVRNIILIVVGVFVVLLAAAASFAYITTQNTSKLANEFIAAVTTKDYKRAYEFFSAELKQAQSYEAFKVSLEDAPLTKECKLNITKRASSINSSGHTKKILTGQLECPQKSYPTEMSFIDTDKGEKLLGYKITSE